MTLDDLPLATLLSETDKHNLQATWRSGHTKEQAYCLHACQLSEGTSVPELMTDMRNSESPYGMINTQCSISNAQYAMHNTQHLKVSITKMQCKL